MEAISDNGSADFQWQPTKCTYEGINHYTSYLIGTQDCKFFMSQGGEYAQGLYVILYPFILFEWSTAKVLWVILNLILISSITILLCIKFKLEKVETYLIIFFILYSIITRVNIIMGQQTIFTLFFLSLPFIYKSKISNILSGICYFKYNIGYSLFLFYLISKKYKQLLLSILPILFGLIIYCLITNTNILENLFQPIQLMIVKSGLGIESGKIFLFFFIRYFFNFNNSLKYLLIITLTFLFNFYFIYKITNLENNLLILSCLCLVILISTPHWSHDNILLTPLLIYSVKYYQISNWLSRINLLTSVYFLYLFRGVQIYSDKIFNLLQLVNPISSNLYPYIHLIILIAVLYINIFFNPFIKKENF